MQAKICGKNIPYKLPFSLSTRIKLNHFQSKIDLFTLNILEGLVYIKTLHKYRTFDNSLKKHWLRYINNH